MTETEVNIDLEGDVMFMVRTEQAVDEGQEKEGQDETKQPTTETLTRFRVSSKILKLASPVFAKALQSAWKSGDELEKTGLVTLSPVDCRDPKAAEYLMLALHLRNRQLPSTVSLELLEDIAFLVDYYDCLEAVELWVSVLGNILDKEAGGNISSTSVAKRLLNISWVFKKTDAFFKVCSMLFVGAKCTVPASDNFLCSSTLDFVNSQREIVVKAIAEEVQRVCDATQEENNVCSVQRKAVTFFALSKRSQDLPSGFISLATESELVSIRELARHLNSIKEYVSKNSSCSHLVVGGCPFRDPLILATKYGNDAMAGIDFRKFEGLEMLKKYFENPMTTPELSNDRIQNLCKLAPVTAPKPAAPFSGFGSR